MVLDIVLLLILVISAYLGYKRGFIKTLASFIGKFIALTLAYLYYAPFQKLLTELTGMDGYVLKKVKLSLVALGGHAAESSVAGSDIDALGKMPLPSALKEKMADYLKQSANSLGNSVAQTLSDFIMSLLAFFLLFLLIAIAISVIVKVLDLVAKLPVLNAFNRVGGVLFSLITTYILLTIAFLLVTSFVSMDASSKLSTMIASSSLAKHFIAYNPILLGLANMSL